MTGTFIMLFRKPKTDPAPDALRDVLASMPTEHLRMLHRIAKAPDKGLRPFFADARNMIDLRDELTRRNDRGQA